MRFTYTQSLIDKAFTYQQYRRQIDEQLAKADTTDPKEEAYLQYTKLNVQRMKRLDKTVKLSDELQQAITTTKSCTWLVLTEGWCGDAAQANPIFNLIAAASAGKIQLRFLLRDANPELMDQHLTNGSRSIPKLIVLNDNFEELASWGPRPATLQNLITEWKSNPNLNKTEWIEKAQAWYIADATKSTQKELAQLILSYS